MATSVPLYLPRKTSPNAPRPICRPNSKSDMGISSKSAPSPRRAAATGLNGGLDGFSGECDGRRMDSEKDCASLSTSVCVAALGDTNGSTYVDPFVSPNAATQTDVDKLAQSFSESMRRPSHSPLNPSKPPLSPVAAARRGDGADFDEIPMSDLEFGRQIGRGAFGEVFRGRYRGTDVAIKRPVSYTHLTLPTKA